HGGARPGIPRFHRLSDVQVSSLQTVFSAPPGPFLFSLSPFFLCATSASSASPRYLLATCFYLCALRVLCGELSFKSPGSSKALQPAPSFSHPSRFHPARGV